MISAVFSGLLLLHASCGLALAGEAALGELVTRACPEPVSDGRTVILDKNYLSKVPSGRARRTNGWPRGPALQWPYYALLAGHQDGLRPRGLLTTFSFEGSRPEGTGALGVRLSARALDPGRLGLAVVLEGAERGPPPVDLAVVGHLRDIVAELPRILEALRVGDRLHIVRVDGEPCALVENFVEGRDQRTVLDELIAAWALLPAEVAVLDGAQDAARALLQSEPPGPEDRQLLTLVRAHPAMAYADEAMPPVEPETGGVRPIIVWPVPERPGDQLPALIAKGRGSEVIASRPFGDPRGGSWDSLLHTVAEDVTFRLVLPKSLALDSPHTGAWRPSRAPASRLRWGAGGSGVIYEELRAYDGTLDPQALIRLEVSYVVPETGEVVQEVHEFTVADALSGGEQSAHKAALILGWGDIHWRRFESGRCGPGLRDWVKEAAPLADDPEVAALRNDLRASCRGRHR